MSTQERKVKSKYQEAIIIRKTQETLDTVTLTLKLSEPFTWLPGQFVMIKATINGKVVNRAYSISSPPLTTDTLDITVRQTSKPTMSKYLQEVKEGDTLLLRGPYGKFIWKEGMSDRIVLLGAGSGITPLKAIIEYVLAKQLPVKMKLLYSSAYWNEVIFKDKLIELSKNNDNFTLILTITREQAPEPWVMKGRFNQERIQTEIKGYEDALYYLCGAPAFVNDMITNLQALGIPKGNIKHEQWSSS